MSGTRYGWLVSYPRSGNTWLRFLLESLMHGGEPVDINAPGLDIPIANRREFDDLFCIDSNLLTDDEIERTRPALYAMAARHFRGPLMLRKVHDRWWRGADGRPMFPAEVSRVAVYLVRDPRDVAVSFAHYAGVDIDEMTRRMADPACTIPTRRDDAVQFFQPLGTWSAHVRSWLDDSGLPVHLVRYEDLQDRAAAELARVAVALGLSPDHAAAAVAAVQFDALRDQEDRHGFRERAGRGDAPFFRRGTAGSWRAVLSAAQARRLERDHHVIMERLGYL